MNPARQEEIVKIEDESGQTTPSSGEAVPEVCKSDLLLTGQVRTNAGAQS